MNPNLAKLQPYPFEKLRQLFAGTEPPADLKEIRLSIGEPQHGTPAFIKETLAGNLAGLANYPATDGSDNLRQAIAEWIARRYGVPVPDAEHQVLPVNGSREALFAFAQCIADPTSGAGVVLCPNPFYQIYEGAAYLAGLDPMFINQVADNGFAMNFDAVADETWRRTQLLYVCSPGNPTGNVLTLADWRRLFELSDRYDFVIASDECYSEIYFDELQPPLGSLQAAHQLGRHDYRNLVMFSSLSKRSNVPGLRSGFVAGDADIVDQFWLYRTYHGCAMGLPIQATSAAAWRDEDHVRDNRRLYKEKFERVTPLLAAHLEMRVPEAGFYLWARTPINDAKFARELHHRYNVTVLPGSFLARSSGGINPGENYVRIALVAGLDECLEAARRITDFCQQL